MSGPVAGWYPDPQGGSSQRWWDGQAWTGHVRQVPAEQTSPPSPQPQPQPQPEAGAASSAASEQPVAGGGGSGRRWLLVGGLLVVAVVAAAGGWWAAGVGGPSGPAASTASDEVEQEPADAGPGTDVEADGGDGAAAPSEQPSPTDAQQWTRVAHDEAVFGGGDERSMQSVTVGGPGLVAVGSGWDDGRDAAAVWTSTDGIAWQRVAHDEAAFGGDSVMRSVTAGGPGLVAVGFDRNLAPGLGAAVWTSTDGLAWERVPHDEAVFSGDGNQAMSSVTVGGPGIVAVGYDAGRDAGAVWTSTDGSVWERVAHDEAVFGGDGTQEMYSVTVGGPGLVAVGFDFGSSAGAVWTSTDGRSWQRVAPDEMAFDAGNQLMRSVTAGGPGLVAVGWETNRGPAAVWTSNDGRSWQRVPHDEAEFGGDGGRAMYSVTVGGPGLVAVGRDGGRDEGAVWTSTDGLVWERVAHDEAVFGGDSSPEMLTAGGPGLVAVGRDLARGAAAVWTSP